MQYDIISCCIVSIAADGLDWVVLLLRELELFLFSRHAVAVAAAATAAPTVADDDDDVDDDYVDAASLFVEFQNQYLPYQLVPWMYLILRS